VLRIKQRLTKTWRVGQVIVQIAALPYVQAQHLAQGKLAIHEKFPDAVANAIIPFLRA
jgi:hypothetical protein